MSPPAWAYHVEYYNPPPDEELVCIICQSVFRDPVRSPCNHVFCRNCIAQWLESNSNCPICRKRTTSSTLQEVVPILKNMILKMTLRCHNSERGCGESFSLESCESHVKVCPFELVQCKNKPCKLMCMRRDIASHEQSTCYYSPVRGATCEFKTLSLNPQTQNFIGEQQEVVKDERGTTQVDGCVEKKNTSCDITENSVGNQGEEGDAGSKGTLRFVVNNFSKLREAAVSPPVFVRNLPWKIKVMPRTTYQQGKSPARSLGFFLECNRESESSTWSCNALAELRLITQKEGVETFVRRIQHLFYSKENDWGFSHFMSWTEVNDPAKGYIKDDTVIFEITVTADLPYDV